MMITKKTRRKKLRKIKMMKERSWRIFLSHFTQKHHLSLWFYFGLSLLLCHPFLWPCEQPNIQVPTLSKIKIINFRKWNLLFLIHFLRSLDPSSFQSNHLRRDLVNKHNLIKVSLLFTLDLHDIFSNRDYLMNFGFLSNHKSS